VKENIKHISEGSSPYRVDALNLVLEKAFELKVEGKGVKLRCSYSRCSWHKNPVSYSSVSSRTCCPNCDNYMQCIGCGRDRTSDYSSCKGCGKKFI